MTTKQKDTDRAGEYARLREGLAPILVSESGIEGMKRALGYYDGPVLPADEVKKLLDKELGGKSLSAVVRELRDEE